MRSAIIDLNLLGSRHSSLFSAACATQGRKGKLNFSPIFAACLMQIGLDREGAGSGREGIILPRHRNPTQRGGMRNGWNA